MPEPRPAVGSDGDALAGCLAVLDLWTEHESGVPVGLDPLEHATMLYSHKEATNRWWDAMSIAAMVAANDADAMAIAGPAMADLKRIQETRGVRAAVEDRDAPFSKHRTYWEAHQASRMTGGDSES